MKLNELGRQKKKKKKKKKKRKKKKQKKMKKKKKRKRKRNEFLAKLYSDKLQASKREPLLAPGSKQRGHSFLRPQ